MEEFIPGCAKCDADCPRPTYALVAFWKVRIKSNVAQVGIEYAHGLLYMYVQGSPVEIQTPAHWNLIGRSMTAPPPVLSPNSILPPPSTHYAFLPEGKIPLAFHRFCYLNFLYLF
jgi:hypothetical protein